MVTRARIGGLLVAMIATSALGFSSTATANSTLTPLKDRRPVSQQQARTVILVSGDRVTVAANGTTAITPRPGVTFLTQKFKGHHYVIPSDALPLLKANRLDKRLFDVAALLEAGYDKRDSVPLIVSGAGKAPTGLTVTRSLKAARGLAAEAPVDGLAGVWKGLKGARSSAYQKIWLDGLRKPSLDVSVPQIGAPSAWASGLDGAGVKVAVLDTGIDAAHPDMLGKILAEKNFVSDDEDGLDRVGHGTHVASTIAGTGTASGGKYKGVAPGASLLDGKVCFRDGCPDSAILAGMQWAADNGAHVVNMSLGGYDGPEVDPIEQAVNDLSASHGMLFVIAAGNSGRNGDETLGSPASADAALAVGAVDKNDVLAEFSSRGPRAGDVALKPEITGPGVAIVAANSKDGFLGTPGESYTTLSGTSMATPHVAGAAAILTQQHPTWTAQQRKSALMAAANPNATDGPFAQGAGRVDIARAITQTVTANPVAISLGRQLWPHEDDTPDIRTVTYHNSGTTAVTLQLTLDSPVSGGVFSLSASTVTVPAGADASVTLTSDTRNGATLGYLGGRIVATAGGLRVQTPFAVERERERLALDLTHIDRGGAPTSEYITSVFNTQTGDYFSAAFGEPTARLRLPPGDYMMWSYVVDMATEQLTTFVQPQLSARANQAITLDARQGQKYKVDFHKPSLQWSSFDVVVAYEGVSISSSAPTPDQIFTVQLGPKHVDGLGTAAIAEWTKPGVPERPWLNAPVVYVVGWSQTGSMYEGFSRKTAQRDFSRIDDTYRSQGGDYIYHFRGMYFPEAGGVASGFEIRPPFKREFYAMSGSMEENYEETREDAEPGVQPFVQMSFPRTISAGQQYTERWSHAVFGPAVPLAHFDQPRMGRYQDLMYCAVPSFGDADGHPGYGVYSSASTSLYRNGKLVDTQASDSGFFEGLPAERARYRVESSVQRGAPATLSTEVRTVWEFDSAYSEDVVATPLTVFGFAPALDDKNSAGKRQVMVVPVDVRQQGNAQPLRTLTLQMSTDDGVTWKRVSVIKILGRTFALITNPAQAGFVSLRAQAEDLAGNTVDQTIIRAYAVR